MAVFSKNITAFLENVEAFKVKRPVIFLKRRDIYFTSSKLFFEQKAIIPRRFCNFATYCVIIINITNIRTWN